MTELLFVRHGETDWNVEQRWQGHADPPLNALGREQARALAETLASERIEALYTSDLRRARETAEIVAARLGVEVRPLPGLREIDVGSWSGLTMDEIRARWPDAILRMQERGWGWEDGETPDDLRARVVTAVRAIAHAHPGKRVVIVSHGGVVRIIAAEAAGMSYAEYRRQAPVVGNCSVSRITCENGGFTPRD